MNFINRFKLRNKVRKLQGSKIWSYPSCPFHVGERSNKVVVGYTFPSGDVYIREYRLIDGTREYDTSQIVDEYLVPYNSWI